MKATLLFVGAMVLAAVTITVVILVNRSPDGGFIIEQCEGRGVAMHWTAADYPVDVYVWEELEAETKYAADLWHEQIGAKVFDVHLYPRFGEPLDPVVVVRSMRGEPHGKAKLKWKAGCVLSRVEISAPLDSSADMNRVMLHELGHALGLAHDDDEKTVMHPQYNWVDEEFQEADLKRIRETMR